ncbi:hypothetical protein B0H14DRAFT_2606883 [Mycena olivaceomarginata]|nr:hypothetical protein B0H14DRAFT_2606883 [Mycena olivaceomarginata]
MILFETVRTIERNALSDFGPELMLLGRYHPAPQQTGRLSGLATGSGYSGISTCTAHQPHLGNRHGNGGVGCVAQTPPGYGNGQSKTVQTKVMNHKICFSLCSMWI